MEQNRPHEARLLLAELQRRYVSVCNENAALRMQIQEYDDILYIARNLTIDNGFYWLVTGAVRQGPFCPDCHNRDGLLVRLVGDGRDLLCPNCRGSFLSPRHKQAETAAAIPDCVPGAFRSRSGSGSGRRGGKAEIIPFRR
jgi:hypothetical protein